MMRLLKELLCTTLLWSLFKGFFDCYNATNLLNIAFSAQGV
jgi:hypothetical protein